MPATDLETIVSLAKRRGFVFPSAEIYGGFANTYDYGPLGVELKRNIREAWWRSMVRERDDVVGLDAALITNPQVWVGSGHVANFTDPLVDCRKCQRRFRADHLAEGIYGEPVRNAAGALLCPNDGGELTEPRQFNMMFKTQVGPVADESNIAYLPPETAQGIFVNFDNVVQSMRRKLPVRDRPDRESASGMKSRPAASSSARSSSSRWRWSTSANHRPTARTPRNTLRCTTLDRGTPELVRRYHRHRARAACGFATHDKDELSHYSAGTTDVEYLFPWGWGELEGIAARHRLRPLIACCPQRKSADVLRRGDR